MKLNLKNIISIIIVACVASIIFIGINFFSYSSGFETVDGINKIKLHNDDGVIVHSEIIIDSNFIKSAKLVFRNSILNKDIVEASVGIIKVDSTIINPVSIAYSDNNLTKTVEDIKSIDNDYLKLGKKTQRTLEYIFQKDSISNIEKIYIKIKLKVDDDFIDINRIEKLKVIDVLQLNIGKNSNMPLMGVVLILVLILLSYIRSLLIKREKKNEIG